MKLLKLSFSKSDQIDKYQWGKGIMYKMENNFG